MSLKIDSAKKLRKEKNKWKRSNDWKEVAKKEEEYNKERLRHKSPTITGQVRVTAGTAKNIRIDIPKTTRPLTDRMKVRIFDILKKDIVNKTVLEQIVSVVYLKLYDFFFCRYRSTDRHAYMLRERLYRVCFWLIYNL